jgi:hypothetical protein
MPLNIRTGYDIRDEKYEEARTSMGMIENFFSEIANGTSAFDMLG